MYSNIAMLPSTDLVHLLGLLNTPLSDNYPLYDPTPQIKPPPCHSLIQIPPLLTTQTHLEKRPNMSDLGNPIQKRIRYNPEVPLHAPQTPILGVYPMFDNTFLPLENSMFQDQDTASFNYYDLNNIQSLEKLYLSKKMAELEQARYEEAQLQSLRNLLNLESLYQQKEEARSCDLSELIIPPLSNSIPSRKSAQNEGVLSNKLEYALHDLQEKMGFPQHREMQSQPVKSVSLSLTAENQCSLLNSKLLNQEQSNINNLAKNKTVKFRPEKTNWNESPTLTGVETNGSCSASDLCESESIISQDETSSTVTINSVKRQKRPRATNIEKQLVCEEKIFQEKSQSLIEVIQIKKKEKTDKEKSEKSQSRTKFDPLFVSKWDVTSERRRNRWQKTEVPSPTKTNDSRKLVQKGSKISNDEDEDVVETPVGEKHQAEITSFYEISEASKGKRCPKLKWNPSSVNENKLASYFKKLEEILECDVNHEKAIKLLVNNEHGPKKVYSHVAGREREYVKEFKIRPKRVPEVPLFGDFRVLY